MRVEPSSFLILKLLFLFYHFWNFSSRTFVCFCHCLRQFINAVLFGANCGIKNSMPFDAVRQNITQYLLSKKQICEYHFGLKIIPFWLFADPFYFFKCSFNELRLLSSNGVGDKFFVTLYHIKILIRNHDTSCDYV